MHGMDFLPDTSLVLLDRILGEDFTLEWREKMFESLEGDFDTSWEIILESNDAGEVDFSLCENLEEDNPSIQCWIFFEKNNPKSGVLMSTFTWDISQSLCKVDFLVEEEFRFLGIASCFYSLFEAELKVQDILFVGGNVSDDGRKFWEKQGWGNIRDSLMTQRDAILSILGDNFSSADPFYYKFLG